MPIREIINEIILSRRVACQCSHKWFVALLNISVTGYAVEPLSREELRSIVYDTSGKISRQYQNMLLGILDLNKLTVDDVMIPRHEIVGVDIEQPWEKIIDHIDRLHQDGVPIYAIMSIKLSVFSIYDALRPLLQQEQVDKEWLEQCLQEPYFVPEGTSLNLQLGYFQQNHEKMAFVVDEYGEIQGMLTLNDILEEIVR